MSIFNSVIQRHEQAREEVERAANAATHAKIDAEDEFAINFHALTTKVATPIFQKFVSDALAYGFPASIENKVDGHDNPILQCRLIPEKGAKFGTNASLECVYWLRGLISEQKVEHASYFDQRPGKNGHQKSDFGLQSINEKTIERGLEEFLDAALKARTE